MVVVFAHDFRTSDSRRQQKLAEIRYIRPYKLRPSQCKNCFRFGHWADSCTRPKCCVRCGVTGADHGTNCDAHIRCCFCGGNHVATNEKCPKWVRQLKICDIRTEHQVRYGMACEVLRREEFSRSKIFIWSS